MDNWKKSFVQKLGQAQQQCARRFEEAMDGAINPVFDEVSAFVRDNGFRVSTPMRENGRRSFKFELAENAYLLIILRFTTVGEFEMRTETFVPGREPVLKKFVGRVADMDKSWAETQFRTGLDNFVDALAGASHEAADAEVEEELAIA